MQQTISRIEKNQTHQMKMDVRPIIERLEEFFDVSIKQPESKEHIEYDENYEFWSVSFKLKKPFHCRNKYFKNFLFSKFSYDCVKSNSRIRQLIQARKMKEVK